MEISAGQRGYFAETGSGTAMRAIFTWKEFTILTAFDPWSLRAQFPSLAETFDGQSAIFFDNPGGTQVPTCVIDAISDYYRTSNANVGGAFATSRRTDEVVRRARTCMMEFLNAPAPETIIFGPNMTTLTFHLARSIGDSWTPGDEVIVTDLDHDANVSPWTDLAARGAVIRTVEFDPRDCTLPLEGFRAALSERTRLVAITHASNAVGTVPDVRTVIQMAHAVGALVFVDAVQYAPHGPIDVQALDCDFLACSAYKFFGPHIGILYGKSEHLERLTPHKVRPAKNRIPNRWETGTQNHECLNGVSSALEYLRQIGTSVGSDGDTGIDSHSHDRKTFKAAMRAIKQYEESLTRHFLMRLREFDDVTLYGIADAERLDERVPTFAFTWPRLAPRATAEWLGQNGICAWSGNYYALRLMERLGLEGDGGAVRIGLAHYNTVEEIDRLMALLHAVPR